MMSPATKDAVHATREPAPRPAGTAARVLFAVAVFAGHAWLLLNPQVPARFGLVMMDRP